MLGKELLDFGAVGLELMRKHAQHPRAGERQPALGAGEHFPRDKLAGPGEDLQAFGIGLRPRQLVAVKELFPFTFACRRQRLRAWKGFQEGPGCRQRPVLEGFEGRRIVFLERTLELVDQSGASSIKATSSRQSSRSSATSGSSWARALQPWPSTRRASAKLQASR